MTITYDKQSEGLYILLSYNSNISFTYCSNPLKIYQEFINFDINEDYKIVGIEIISGKTLFNTLKKNGYLDVNLNKIKNELLLKFSNINEEYTYINNDNSYDENDILFGNIVIGFSVTNRIIYIKFKNANKILDLDKINLNIDIK